MRLIVHTYAKKFVLLIIAMQILNLSVYGGDFGAGLSPTAKNSIGEFNQIDCLIEYIAEIMLDHKNAFPENGSHNTNGKSSHQIKHTSIKMIEFGKNTEQPFYCTGNTLAEIFDEDYKKLILREINPPPPKA